MTFTIIHRGFKDIDPILKKLFGQNSGATRAPIYTPTIITVVPALIQKVTAFSPCLKNCEQFEQINGTYAKLASKSFCGTNQFVIVIIKNIDAPMKIK